MYADTVTQNPLSIPDIRIQMNDIFRVHLTQKKMTPEILHLALANYINQFDPHHVYLLASDVAPFLEMSDANLLLEVKNFNEENYSLFEKLNIVIQNAIKKMRKLRLKGTVDEEHIAEITKESLPIIPQNAITDMHYFAKNEQQLNAWHTIYMADLILSAIENVKALHRGLAFKEAIHNVEVLLEEHENDYLYLDNQNKPLNITEKNALFALRVLQALTKSLDIHSQFLTPQQARNLEQNLEKEYVGIGIGIQELGNGFAISEIVKGSSAEDSGKIQIGDELITINSQAVAGMSAENLFNALRGKPDTVVALTLKNKDTGIYSIHLVRKQIVIQEGRVESSYQKIAGGILATVHLHGFYQGDGNISSEQDVRSALESLSKNGNIKGLVLDLRDNPGGLVEQAVKVAGLFIKTGIIFAAKDARGILHSFRDIDPAVAYTGPLIILINKHTASAAEIVTQALKDYGIGIVVGDTQSFGKGSLQIVNPDVGGLNITIGKYYSVSGHSIQKIGVKADIIVPGSASDSLENKNVGEAHLQGALERDDIAPLFIDSLRDISVFQRPWYQRHYRPFIQVPTETYRKWIPSLASRSRERIKNNANYQNLLHDKLHIIEGKDKDAKLITLTPEQAQKTLSHLQEQEAANITLDLIHFVK